MYGNNFAKWKLRFYSQVPIGSTTWWPAEFISVQYFARQAAGRGVLRQILICWTPVVVNGE
jgi:hypothetical protein